METTLTHVGQSSVLTKWQERTLGPTYYTDGRMRLRLIATVRHDDRCGNGHNTFSITGDVCRAGPNGWIEDSGGCLHDLIAVRFPELRPLIKWHLCSTDGPMHYIANTVHHADEHGPTHAWIYYTGAIDPAMIGGIKERLVGYIAEDKVRDVEGRDGYRVEWDEMTAKVRNLDHARSSAVWPDATDEDLIAPGLEERLVARLPALMVEFKAAVESLGFTW